MDYVVGSVAALVSGNVTPSRPKLLKRALTPTKHQPSPNVTPRSEYVDDRSIFMSPTLQKKKAIVKKSPKRIFQNPDLDTTVEEGNSNLANLVVDKAKKHLKEQLETDGQHTMKLKSPKSTKETPDANAISENIQNSNVPLKKKKRRQTKAQESSTEPIVTSEDIGSKDVPMNISPKKATSNNKESQSNQLEAIETDSKENAERKENTEIIKTKNNKKHKKKKNKAKVELGSENTEHIDNEIHIEKRKSEINMPEANDEMIVNPNAITAQDTDSEHESDHEIQSEDEHKESLDTGPAESSDEEEKESEKKGKNKKAKETKTDKANMPQEESEDEVKRTLFIGNVLYKPKTKKDIKKLFSQYGDIDTVRIRAVPVKDATMTPKLAIIKNELHPERTTVNVYVKYQKPESVEKALSANNTVLDGHHLRVTRSDITGTLDTKCSIFIGNLPFAIEDETLRSKFEKCGEIESVRIVRDEKTGAGKGFGYVNFKSKDAVELALALSEEDLTIKNRILRVNRCLQIHSKKSNKNNRDNRNSGNRNVGNNRNGGYNRNDGNYRNGGNNRIAGNNRNSGFDRNGGNRNFGNRNFDNGNRGFNRNAPGKFDRNNGQEQDGAFRRLANKRKNQDESEGPANKLGKKERKEFVGRTAEKKKKGKFNKGQKKKKALSEILTK
ncbi:nucleolar protein 12 isoform X2 [Pieris napi]|uniref:nucleolar protein 12 isoform X2 n=1 Tax=Pieris napi TaxID=78633 RepID=UPI001FBB708A|nr:nucleolar protein 12 isoform X2 [Pieris napi]